MTRNTLLGLVVEDLEIKRIAFRNLRARTSERVEVLGLDLEDILLENIVEYQRMMFKYARPSLIGICLV